MRSSNIKAAGTIGFDFNSIQAGQAQLNRAIGNAESLITVCQSLQAQAGSLPDGGGAIAGYMGSALSVANGIKATLSSVRGSITSTVSAYSAATSKAMGLISQIGGRYDSRYRRSRILAARRAGIQRMRGAIYTNNRRLAKARHTNGRYVAGVRYTNGRYVSGARYTNGRYSSGVRYTNGRYQIRPAYAKASNRYDTRKTSAVEKINKNWPGNMINPFGILVAGERVLGLSGMTDEVIEIIRKEGISGFIRASAASSVNGMISYYRGLGKPIEAAADAVVTGVGALYRFGAPLKDAYSSTKFRYSEEVDKNTMSFVSNEYVNGFFDKVVNALGTDNAAVSQMKHDSGFLKGASTVVNTSAIAAATLASGPLAPVVSGILAGGTVAENVWKEEKNKAGGDSWQTFENANKGYIAGTVASVVAAAAGKGGSALTGGIQNQGGKVVADTAINTVKNSIRTGIEAVATGQNPVTAVITALPENFAKGLVSTATSGVVTPGGGNWSPGQNSPGSPTIKGN